MNNISEKHKKLVTLIHEECKNNEDFKALMQQSFLYPYIEANSLDNNKKADFCCQGTPMQQAEEFYKDFINLFPTELLIALKSDFIKMLFNQRTNNFSDFSIACYQQIENILNFLLSNKSLRQYLLENIDQKVYTGRIPSEDKNNPQYGPLTFRNLIFNNTDSNKKYLQDSTIRFENKTYFKQKRKL